MSTMVTYRMLGKIVRIHFDSSKTADRLKQELSIYPIFPIDENHDIEVDLHYPTVSGTILANNPSNIRLLEDGFEYISLQYSIIYRFTKGILSKIYFKVNEHASATKRSIQKILNKQFNHRAESIGQLFHEVVYLSIGCMSKDLAPIHGSAMRLEDGRVVIVGGTGGVGKTSTEIELCHRHRASFIADDICFVSSDGHCYPNLSYPKIYAYNVVGDPAFGKLVMADRSLGDRGHWTMYRLLGASVRRRSSPASLYRGYISDSVRLDEYYLLNREAVDQIDSLDMGKDQAVNVSISIIRTELTVLLNAVRNYELNSLFIDKEPQIAESAIISKWKSVLDQAFESISLRRILIPMRINHQKMKEAISKSILSS